MITNNFIEKRENVRLKKRYDMKSRLFNYGSSTISYDGSVIDISSKGTLFKSSVSYNVDTLLQLDIKLGNWTEYRDGFSTASYTGVNQPLKVIGKTLRASELLKDQYEVAVEFICIDQNDKVAVDRYVKKLLNKR